MSAAAAARSARPAHVEKSEEPSAVSNLFQNSTRADFAPITSSPGFRAVGRAVPLPAVALGLFRSRGTSFTCGAASERASNERSMNGHEGCRRGDAPLAATATRGTLGRKAGTARRFVGTGKGEQADRLAADRKCFPRRGRRRSKRPDTGSGQPEHHSSVNPPVAAGPQTRG